MLSSSSSFGFEQHTRQTTRERKKKQREPEEDRWLYIRQSYSSKNWSIFMKNMFYNRLPISDTDQLKFLEGAFCLFIYTHWILIAFFSTSYSILRQTYSMAHNLLTQRDCLTIAYRSKFLKMLPIFQNILLILYCTYMI